MDTFDSGDFYLFKSAKVATVDCAAALNSLQEDEKRYIHYYSKACWIQGLIKVAQSSSDSPTIFVMLQNLFRYNELEDLETIAKCICGFSEPEWQSFKLYAAGFYHNLGNFDGYRRHKFIPQVAREKLHSLIVSSNAYLRKGALMEELWKSCADGMYSQTNDPFPDSFHPQDEDYSLCSNDSMGKTDVAVLDDTSKLDMSKDAECGSGSSQRQRVADVGGELKNILPGGFEAAKTMEEVRVRTVTVALPETTSYDGDKGWCTPLMAKIGYNLQSASTFASHNKSTVEEFALSFVESLVDRHEAASRQWVLEKNDRRLDGHIQYTKGIRDPNVETGFKIEGFIGIVKDECQLNAYLCELTKHGEEIVKLLPWATGLEKDVYQNPVVSAITVVNYASSAIALGTTLPCYESVTQNAGFKCFCFDNIPDDAGLTSRKPQFLSADDETLLNKHSHVVFNMLLILRELFGHGSGELRREDENGNTNCTSSDDLTCNSDNRTYYQPGETFSTVFANADRYEEFRADAVALYLSQFPLVLECFGVNDVDVEEVKYCVYLTVTMSALQALGCYDYEEEMWGNPQAESRFMMLQSLRLCELVKVEIVDGADRKPDMLLTLNRELVNNQTHFSIGYLACLFQFGNSVADPTELEQFIADHSYSFFPCPRGCTEAKKLLHKQQFWMRCRRISMDRSFARLLLVQGNTKVDESNGGQPIKVTFEEYPATVDGMIRSFQERYCDAEELESALLDSGRRVGAILSQPLPGHCYC